jgi:hypothetical protein
LLEISPSPLLPSEIESDKYYIISRICAGICGVLRKNEEGVNDMICCSPLIKYLLSLLESTSSKTVGVGTTITPHIYITDIEKYICWCFNECTFFSYQQCSKFVEYNIINVMIEFIEKHINKQKKNNEKLDNEIIKIALNILYNITNIGYKESKEEEKNKFRNFFDEITGINRMYELFQFFNNLIENDENKDENDKEREIVDYISIIIYYLLKSDINTPLYKDVMIHLHNLRSSGSRTPGLDFAWDADAHIFIRWNSLMDDTYIHIYVCTYVI